MSETKTELLIIKNEEDARGPPRRSMDYKMFNASLFFLPTIGLLRFQSNYAAAHGVPASSREKAEFLLPVYNVLVVFSLVTVVFTWIFRTSGMSTSANILIGINCVLVCIMGPMLVWELVTLQAYIFFVMLAAAIFIAVVCVIVGGEKK